MEENFCSICFNKRTEIKYISRVFSTCRECYEICENKILEFEELPTSIEYDFRSYLIEFIHQLTQFLYRSIENNFDKFIKSSSDKVLDIKQKHEKTIFHLDSNYRMSELEKERGRKKLVKRLNQLINKIELDINSYNKGLEIKKELIKFNETALISEINEIPFGNRDTNSEKIKLLYKKICSLFDVAEKNSSTNIKVEYTNEEMIIYDAVAVLVDDPRTIIKEKNYFKVPLHLEKSNIIIIYENFYSELFVPNKIIFSKRKLNIPTDDKCLNSFYYHGMEEYIDSRSGDYLISEKNNVYDLNGNIVAIKSNKIFRLQCLYKHENFNYFIGENDDKYYVCIDFEFGIAIYEENFENDKFKRIAHRKLYEMEKNGLFVRKCKPLGYVPKKHLNFYVVDEYPGLVLLPRLTEFFFLEDSFVQYSSDNYFHVTFKEDNYSGEIFLSSEPICPLRKSLLAECEKLVYEICFIKISPPPISERLYL